MAEEEYGGIRESAPDRSDEFTKIDKVFAPRPNMTARAPGTPVAPKIERRNAHVVGEHSLGQFAIAAAVFAKPMNDANERRRMLAGEPDLSIETHALCSVQPEFGVAHPSSPRRLRSRLSAYHTNVPMNIMSLCGGRR